MSLELDRSGRRLASDSVSLWYAYHCSMLQPVCVSACDCVVQSWSGGDRDTGQWSAGWTCYQHTLWCLDSSHWHRLRGSFYVCVCLLSGNLFYAGDVSNVWLCYENYVSLCVLLGLCYIIMSQNDMPLRGLMRGMATLPQGNLELIVVRDKVGRPPCELGVSKSMECDIFPSVLQHCWLGDRKGIWPVKNWMLVCWWWWFDWSFARLIAPVVTTTSIIICFNKHRLTQVHMENGRWNGESERVHVLKSAMTSVYICMCVCPICLFCCFWQINGS